MGIQLSLFALPADPPLETDPDREIYFWASGSEPNIITHSNRPHVRLPFYCPLHRNYTDRPCPADHTPAGIARLIEHRERLAAVVLPKRRAHAKRK
jgi:hypothetical protein